ncbi:unnamed protein product [Ixodes pacificus]
MIECDILAVPLFNLKFSKDTSVLREYLYALFCRFISMPLFSYHFYIGAVDGSLGRTLTSSVGMFLKRHIVSSHAHFCYKFLHIKCN